MSKCVRSDARTEVEPGWMSIPHFLTWPDSSNWEEVKHMEWGNSVSWVISRNLFRYQPTFLTSLSKSAGSGEPKPKFQAGPRAWMSPPTFCCRLWQRMISWVLTEPRGLRRGDDSPWKEWRNSRPHLKKKRFSVALQIALEERGRLSWAAAEGGFDEDQCCWGAAGWDVLSAAGLRLFS